MDIKTLLKQLTLEEKAALLSGSGFMGTNSVPRLNIPSVLMSDGPHGLRVQGLGGDNGVDGSAPATAFPTAACTASGWNAENAYKMGVAMAEEALHYGIDLVLGPGVCIKKNPLCGRNFEYFSEDPLLAGKMAAAEVNGIQSKNVGATVKHFALNNAENYRFMGDSVCDERAIREIYLKVYEIVAKESHPHAVMCAYNKVNGTYCSENEWLLTDLLRDEFGFDGLVMSDWGATHDRVKGVAAGLDLEMPGDTAICRKWIVDAVNDGTLKAEQLDKAVENVLCLVGRYESNSKGGEVDWKAHDSLAAEIAEDCAVLLKNDGALPLGIDESVLIVGDMFDKMRYQGSGSSMINPAFLTTPKAAFDSHGVNYKFVRGYAENELEPNAELIGQAVAAAKDYDKVLVFAGLTDYAESEGGDRESMRMPAGQLALIDALVSEGKKIVVVLYCGAPMELPFAESVSAILNMYLPGQNGGTATYDLLFGLKSPCGKLAETWARSYSDLPFGDRFSKSEIEVYKESVFVGYRYYLTAKKEVRYPFGYGLSYTTFDYSDIAVGQAGDKYTVSCRIKNTGACDGAEIVQLYVQAPHGVFKPLRELKGFTKVYLKAGETKLVEIEVDKSALGYWNMHEKRYVLERGDYELQICSDCETVKLAQTVNLAGDGADNPYPEDINSIYANVQLSRVDDGVFERMSGLKIPPIPPAKPLRLDSRFTDMKATPLGRIIFRKILGRAKKDMKEAKKLPAGAERDNRIKGAVFYKRLLESNTLTIMTMCPGYKCPYNHAQGLVHLANGRIFKALKCFCTKIKAPPLPKDND